MPRLSLFSPALAVALRPRHVRALHARFGGLDGVDADDSRAVARALFARVLPDALVLALEEIERFATPLGREALLEAARTRSPDPLAAHPDDGAIPDPLDLAARVVLASRKKTADGDDARAIARRARVRVERSFSPRSSYEILAPAAPFRADALLEAAREVHQGALFDAWTVTHDGVLFGAFLHEGPRERVMHVREGDAAPRRFRPIVADRVRFDAGRARLGFQLARPALLPAWTRAVGRAAFGDAAALSPRPTFTLRAPHERGVAWFAGHALPAAVRAVTVVGCELDDGSRFSARSANALADLHERLGARGGYLVRVTLRFEMRAGEKTDATIELPNKLTLADPRLEDDVRAAIDAILLTAPGTLGDDLGSLAPFEHAAWRWVEVVTALGFEAAVASGLLARAAASRRAADVAHRSYGSSLILHDLEGEDAKYALGEDLSMHAYDVAPESTVRWKLDASRLAASLATRLHLAPMRLKRAAPSGLLPIGLLEANGNNACIFQLMRIVRDSEAGDLREELRAACAPAHAVVLAGKGRSLGKGTVLIEIDPARLFTDGDFGDVLVAIAEALGIEDDIDAWRFATDDEPLVIRVERGEVWFRKVRLLLTTNQFTMVLVLARSPRGQWVGAAELGERISSNATIVDQIARKARVGFDERVEKSFAEAGVPMPPGLPGRLIEVDKGRGRYRLGVGVVVR
jgi:hypothetical protein